MSEAKDNKNRRFFRTVTQEMIDLILQDIAEGSTIRHAAESNGLTDSHFHNLVAQGKVDLNVNKTDTLQARLVVSLRTIEKAEIKRCRQNILSSCESHKGAEWTLKHAYWRDFGANAEIKQLSEEIELLRSQLGVMNNGQVNSGEAEEDSKE